MAGLLLALDERLAVQKVLIQMGVDCGEALADARSSAKLEIARLMAAEDAAGIQRLKARVRVPAAKKARPAAGRIAERGSSQDAQPTIRWSKALSHSEAALNHLHRVRAVARPGVLDRACGLHVLTS